MKKLLILGDSFSDNSVKTIDHECWMELLGKKYNVVNLSQYGSGPDYALQKMKEVNIEDFAFLIFVYSDPKRLNFSFLKHPSHSVTAKWIFENYGNKLKERWFLKSAPDANIEKEYLLKYALEIYCYYLKNMDQIINHEKIFLEKIIKIKNFLEKIIILPAFNKFKTNNNYKNIFISEFILNDVSSNEIISDSYEKYYDDLKFRNNHLSSDNHYKLYDYLINILEKSKIIRCEFSSNLFSAKSIGSQFIYT